MTALSKTLLTVAAIGLAGGSVIDFYYNADVNPSLTAVLPLGAIAFGLFLIVLVLQKEVALFDIEQKKKLQSLPVNAATAKPNKNTTSQPYIVQLKEKTL